MSLTYTGPAETVTAPLFERYEGQLKPQPAFLELDPQNGSVRFGTDLEVGNGVPMDVWHHRVLRWDVPPNLTGRGCAEVYGEMSPLLEQVASGHSIEWDGHNMVGRMTEAAREASEGIEDRLRGAHESFECAEVWDAGEWIWVGQTLTSLGEHLGITPDTTDQEIAAIAETEQQIAAREHGAVLFGDLSKELRDVRERLRELASDESLSP